MTDEQEVLFQLCIRLHERFLRSVCYRLAGEREAGDDLLSECLLVLHARFGSYDPERPFEPWARVVIERHFYSLYQREKRYQGVELDALQELLPAPKRPEDPEEFMEVPSAKSRPSRD